MRLKRITIFGFKTFAERTDIDLRGDLIAVVGPNGCGKSNIVDAILWALGEPSPKHLRAQTTTDVIFAGSARRRPLGYAEVTLVFDNEDGTLPVPTAEVVITRKATRAGEGSYAINRQPCRLRDVYDLLADSGLGKSGYAIVTQKEIDQALAASPEDRRAWVDEAAGVQRYRQRKHESFRRLAAAEDHLARIKDILHEVEQQREPLREEAEKARRYKSAADALREVECGMLVVQVADLVREMEAAEASLQRLAHTLTQDNGTAVELEGRIATTEGKRRKLEEELAAIRAEQHRLSTEADRCEAQQKLNAQRLRGLDELEATLREDATRDERRQGDAAREVEEREAELKAARETLERVRSETAGAGAQADAVRRELADAEKALAAARETHARVAKERAEADHRADRLKEVLRELEGIERAMPDLVAAEQEAKAALEEQEARLQADHDQAATARGELRRLEAAEAEEAQTGRSLATKLASLEGRHRAIEHTIETHEGLNHGARAVLEAAERGVLTASYTPVAEAFETDRELALAIETALGAAANDLIVADERAAREGIEFLKRERAGRATFQPLTLMRPSPPNRELSTLAHRKGVLGRASELVRCRKEHEPVAESLLGRILIVETLDIALELARTTGWSRLVSLDGEVVHSSGAVTGGTTGKPTFGMVQRKAELGELEREMAGIQQSLAKLAKSGKDRAVAKEAARTTIQEAERAAQGVQRQVAEAARWHREVHHELESTQKSAMRLTAERERLEAAAGPIAELPGLASLESARDDILKRLAGLAADSDLAAERLKDAEQRLAQAEVLVGQATRRLEAARDGEQSRARKLASLGPERDQLKQANEALEKESEAFRNQRKSKDAEYTGALERRKALEAAIESGAEDLKKCRERIQAATEASHQAELTRARSDARRASVAQRLLEEYGVDETAAIETAPHTVVPSDAVTVVGRLRRELREMGDVNLGAIEAYERLTQRAGELVGQLDDVDASIAQIRASITELDKLTRDRFVDTFAQLEVAFTEMFDRLFGGGSGKLSLSKPDDILDTGIEIDVQLPGKKKQKLELLSGGERSLCATAFLFALLRVKPSPLVILDEVDAPLDGRNVERYADMLRDFSATTQFIFITHNPTTIEAAHIWLGVTMQEPGVTSVIPCSVPVEPSGQRLFQME